MSQVAQLVTILNNSTSESEDDIFEVATKLFLKEWANDQDNDVVDFIDYFKKEWLDMNSNWFEGYNHPENRGSPSTNTYNGY